MYPGSNSGGCVVARYTIPCVVVATVGHDVYVFDFLGGYSLLTWLPMRKCDDVLSASFVALRPNLVIQDVLKCSSFGIQFRISEDVL